MKNFIASFAFATALLCGVVSADDLYVKNQHVPQVRNVEGRRFVELKPFVAALGMELSKSGHGWLVGEEGRGVANILEMADMPLLRPGEVWLSGTVLKSRFVGGEVSISLGEAAQAMGATLVPNAALKTTDFRLPQD